MQLYNSKTRKKSEFVPLKGNRVRIYTCGPTVYDSAHIGNFRAFVFEDLLKRYLLLKGFDVTHIMNITDVDDRTIQRSIERGIPIQQLTAGYTSQFMRDLDFLKVQPADVYPRATEHIPEMISLIESLINRNHAYISGDGSVYFAIKSFKDYGSLTQLSFNEQQATDRVSEDDYSKENPQDFALWKSWKPEDGPVAWDSPWGRGRPGWHIECSAMSMKYLGQYFDIHCGGVDNMFPHHENEIAQSIGATGKPFVNVWIHNEHLLVDGGKMSKSLGNYYLLTDLEKKGFTPEALRFILLSTHYRSKVNFSMRRKREALKAVQRIQELWDQIQWSEQEIQESRPNLPPEYFDFIAAMDDDLDTPKALGIVYDWIRKTNIDLSSGTISEYGKAAGREFLRRFNTVFGLIAERESIPQEVKDLAFAREAARNRRDWAEADKIRGKLHDLGWIVQDTPTGPKCRKAEA